MNNNDAMSTLNNSEVLAGEKITQGREFFLFKRVKGAKRS
jgi:hypothetical protein